MINLESEIIEEKQKIYSDKDILVENIIKEAKSSLLKILDKLPNEEIPFMEPHLRALYFQTYFLLAEGSYNPSLVLCGILLENILKEKLFLHGVSDVELENMNFGQAIDRAEKMKLLKEEELNFFKTKKDTLRNPYAHYNKMKLSQGIYYPMWKIPSKDIVQKLIELDQKVKKGEINEVQAQHELIKGIQPELMSSEEFLPLAHLIKTNLEKDGFALSIFLDLDKFVRKFAEDYFKPKNVTKN